MFYKKEDREIQMVMLKEFWGAFQILGDILLSILKYENTVEEESRVFFSNTISSLKSLNIYWKIK